MQPNRGQSFKFKRFRQSLNLKDDARTCCWSFPLFFVFLLWMASRGCNDWVSAKKGKIQSNFPDDFQVVFVEGLMIWSMIAAASGKAPIFLCYVVILWGEPFLQLRQYNVNLIVIRINKYRIKALDWMA